MRVDIVSVPFAGHLFPLLDLARYVSERAIADIRILSTEDAIAAVDASQLPFLPLLPGKGHRVREIAETASQVGSNPLRLFRQLKMNLALLDEVRTQLLDVWHDDPPDLVLADSVVPIAGMVARQLGIRWWTSMPSPCVLETGSGTPAYLGGWVPRPGIYGRMRDYYGRKFVRTFKRTAAFMVRKQLRQLGIPSLYREDGLESIYSPERILGLSVEPFEFDREWPSHFTFLGPVTGSPPFPFHEPEFVPDKKHILITLGTHLWWAKEQIVATLQPVARAMPDCVFHFTRGKPDGSKPQIDENLHQYDYFPYDTYMDRYDAAIVHGGTGIVYSCLRSATPMLVWPHDYDQFDHAARIVTHRLGLRCHPSPKPIEADLRRLLNDPEIYEHLARFRNIIKNHNPHESFANLLSTLGSK
ncbi:MAG: glycosyltransferase [Planctomycetia bacterium]